MDDADDAHGDEEEEKQANMRVPL